MLVSKILPDNYPPRWNDYRSVRELVRHTSDFTSEANVNRFAARYRFAKSFQVTLNGYSASTAGGYAAIMRLALSWSAFEALLAAIGVKKQDLSTIGALHDASGALADMRRCGHIMPFFKFVARELDTRSQKQAVEAFVAGQVCVLRPRTREGRAAHLLSRHVDAERERGRGCGRSQRLYASNSLCRWCHGRRIW